MVQRFKRPSPLKILGRILLGVAVIFGGGIFGFALLAKMLTAVHPDPANPFASDQQDTLK